MTSDLAVQLVDEATGLVRSGQPFTAVFDRVVALGAEALPSPAWDDIAAIDVKADVDRTCAWLVRQIDERPPPDEMSGVWFGLYERRGSVPGRFEAVTAVTGAPGFPDPHWLDGRNWEPPGYAPAGGLSALLPFAFAGGPELRDLVASAVVLAYGLGFTAAVVDGVDQAKLLGGRAELAVATGFADGEVALVGILTPSGLDRSRLAEA